MKQEIQLFIGGEEVEFSKDPQILLNYNITDSTNPTAIKNTYSKSIVLDGTQTNNAIFGNIWNLERMQYYGYDGGVGFNPIKKTAFELYVNGELYESGYVKLDNVTNKNGRLNYSITLFGGLGSLFFSLTYNDNEGDRKKTLADLRYGMNVLDGTSETLDLNFKINKDAVFDAWNVIMGGAEAVYDEDEVDRPNNYLYDNKWNTLNFMPAYDGIPKDFSANKVLINSNDTSFFTTSQNDFGTVNGFALGETSEDLTQNQTKDLRSYLQRPVLRMRSLIDACCDPINNGGWELKLDDKFFNRNNPYYNDTWLTLTNISDNFEGGETETLTSAIMVKEDGMYYRIYTGEESLGDYSNIRLNLNLFFTPTSSTTKNRLYLDYKYEGDTSGLFAERTKYYHYEGAYLIQLVAYNSIGNVVAQSDTQYLWSGEATGYEPIYDVFKGRWTSDGIPSGDIKYRNGYFIKKNDGNYYWSENLMFTLPNNISFNYLKLKVLSPYRIKSKIKKNLVEFDRTESVGYTQNQLWGNPYIQYDGNKTLSEAIEAGGSVRGSFDFSMGEVNMISQDYEALYSNTLVTISDIISTTHTPADYLIGYAKMFGLYFWRDPAERASDPQKFPKGVIHLMDRSTFYTNEIVDLEDLIDQGKDTIITPQLPTKKWLSFELEQVESEAAADYENTYGEVYGDKLVNTNFNFNNDTEKLIENTPYKGGIDVLEVDKYFNQWINNEIPSYVFDGFKYTLFKPNGSDYETIEIEVPIEKNSYEPINNNGWTNTDSFAKLQFHSANNEPIDAENVMVFFNGSSYINENNNRYWLTDDIIEMVSLNNGEPCWILTHTSDTIPTYNLNGIIGAQTIAYPLDYIPVFQRNKVGYGGMIEHSLSMGEPRITYVRDTIVSNDMSIYSKCWRKFLSDIYDVNNRQLTCYLRFPERPNSLMLRRFYWFDNVIWRLNKITDWDISSYDSTKCEFVKVMDMENYENDTIKNKPNYSFIAANLTLVNEEEDENGNTNKYYTISANRQDVILRASTNGETWCINDSNGYVEYEYSNGSYETIELSTIMTPTAECNEGDGERTVIIPLNESLFSRTFDFFIKDNDNKYHSVYITQEGGTSEDINADFSLEPNTLEVGGFGGTYRINVVDKTIDDYTIEIPIIGTADWVTITTKTDDYFEIQVAENNTDSYIRIGAIRVIGEKNGQDDVVKILTIRQTPIILS